jgi:hypothetical protein
MGREFPLVRDARDYDGQVACGFYAGIPKECEFCPGQEAARRHRRRHHFKPLLAVPHHTTSLAGGY